MTVRQTAVTADTVGRLQIDAAVISVGGEALGATRGGVAFSVDQEIRDPQLDGAGGPVEGTRRVVRSTATLTVSALEWTSDNRDLALIDGTGAYIIDAEDHADVVVVGALAGGGTATITLADAICITPAWEIEDQNEGRINLEFQAHYDPSSLGTVPWTVVVE